METCMHRYLHSIAIFDTVSEEFPTHASLSSHHLDVPCKDDLNF